MAAFIFILGLLLMIFTKNMGIDTNYRMIFLGLYLVAIALGGIADRIGKELKDAFSRIIFTSERRS